MRRITYLIAVALSLGLLAAFLPGSYVAAAPPAATVEVAAADFEFQPQSVTINAGDTITWTNTGAAPHTATASDGSWDSGNLDPGQTFSRTFDTPGTYNYYCRYHGTPEGTGMAGTIVVQAQAQPTPAPATPTAAPAPTEPAPTQPPGVTPSIQANDQPLENNTITVERVVAAQDGWIVVHLDENGRPGPVIGHTAVSAGESANVQVPLDQPPSPGTMIWPMLHIDAGSIGVYEFPGPDSPVTVDGQIVMVQITVTAAGEAAPGQLPRTGSGDMTSLWLLGGLALALLAAGAFIRRRRTA